MWRAAPVKAAKISRGKLSQYRSKASLNGGGRPLAIACAIRLACSSVGEDFGWVRLIEAPPRITGDDSRESVSFLFGAGDIHSQIRALGVGQVERNYPAWWPLVVPPTPNAAFGRHKQQLRHLCWGVVGEALRAAAAVVAIPVSVSLL